MSKLNIEVELEYLVQSIPEIRDPFNPQDVDIVAQSMVVSNVVERLKYNEIILDPDFQRNIVWDDVRQSRLIESFIISVPLPTFYFDMKIDEDGLGNKLIVVDGLQRLWTMKRFMVYKKDHPNCLRLTGLEYVRDYEGFCFDELPMPIQRRINETSLSTYVIRPGTSDDVKTSIFTRINTGGLYLTPAEIKNSVYRGKAAGTLKELADSKEFKSATNNKVDPSRMDDRELVNRFFSFYILNLSDYNGNLEEYLKKALKILKRTPSPELDKWKKDFRRAMDYCEKIFCKKAFRRIDKNGKYYSKLNKPLFECVSVCFAKISEEDYLKISEKREDFISKYEKLFLDEKFNVSISRGTAGKSNVEYRHNAIRRIIDEVIFDD